MSVFNTTAVLLNGPPGIGKDTLADALIERYSNYTTMMKMEYKDGLRRATAQRYNVNQEQADLLFAHRKQKEIPHYAFGNISPRDALIETDTYLKEKHGKSMVGEWAAKAVQDEIQHNGIEHFIFSDSGFLAEAEMVAEKVDFLIVVNLMHPDYNFDKDSRDYVTLNGANSCTIQFHRKDGAIEEDTRRLVGQITDAVWENRNK